MVNSCFFFIKSVFGDPGNMCPQGTGLPTGLCPDSREGHGRKTLLSNGSSAWGEAPKTPSFSKQPSETPPLYKTKPDHQAGGPQSASGSPSYAVHFLPQGPAGPHLFLSREQAGFTFLLQCLDWCAFPWMCSEHDSLRAIFKNVPLTSKCTW